jgi:DHA2 family multidrug resistance protein
LSFLAIFAFMVASLSSSFLAPNFLIFVTHLRPEQIGNFSAPYAILLLICATVGAVMLVRTIGPRLSLIVGFTCFALSSWLGMSLTSLWAIPEFELIVVLQTVAEEITFLAAVIMILSRADPARTIALSAYIQLLRLICAEIATTTMATWIRQREQLHSYLLGLHVTSGASDLSSTLTALGSGSGSSASQLDAARRGVGLLATIVQREANVLAYIDGFWIAFAAAIVGLCAVALMARAPPHPLTQRVM